MTKREFWVRLRDKGFLISATITLLVLSGFIVAGAVAGDDTPSFRLAVARADAASFGPPAEQVAAEQDLDLTIVGVPDREAASRAVLSGSVDAAVVGTEMLVDIEAPPELEVVLAEAQKDRAIREQLQDQGLSEGDLDAILDPPALRPVPLGDAPSAERRANSSVAFVALLLLYGQLFGFGVWVASGVVEEKSSRVVEVLLSTIRARQLLAGKVVGIGLLGLTQLAGIGAIGLSLSLATGTLEVPGRAVFTLVVTLFWFALGFAFYASLFAVAGALVSRMEELQNAIMPLNLLILGSFFVSLTAVDDPDATLARVASLVPFSSPFAMPPRIALGAATAAEAVASIVLLLGATALAIPLAGRLYSGAILRIGARVKLRTAWRATR